MAAPTDPAAPAGRRGILVLDMSYTLRMIQARQLEQALDARDVAGFFDHVISVHPLAGLFEAGGARYGPPAVSQLSPRQTVVEGRLGRWHTPRVLAPLNLVAAQVSLLRQVVALARAHDVRVIRVGDPYFLGLLGVLLAWWLGLPLVIRVPGRYDEIRRLTGRAIFPRLFRYPWVEKRIERFVFPRCDLIAGANDDNMRYALENGGRPEVATVFRYGNLLHTAHWPEPASRASAIAELAELGLDGRPFVATVTRLEPIKRAADFIRAVAQMRALGVTVHGLLIGDGSQRPELERLAAELGIADAIVLAGDRGQEWIARVLPHAAVILSPHMGRALAEAALAAVPVVAYAFDWHGEVVVDGQTGYLVADGDWQAMAERAASLVTDRALAQRLGTAGRAAVLEMMDPGRLMRHEQAAYAGLLRAWSRHSRRSRRNHPEGSHR